MNLLPVLLSFFLIAESPPSNVLPLGGGDIQVNAQVLDRYTDIVPNKPINASIMITHDSNEKVDEDSFRLGDKPIQVGFIKSEKISPYSTLEVSIYQFKIDGKPTGIYTLSPVFVKVGGKQYQSLPISVQVP